MVPDKFNMVDMEGIDLLESQGLEIEGLYDKLVESITLCRYTILYNWKFDGVEIPPSYFELEVENNIVSIGYYVSVNSDDILHIHSIQTEANIVPISITENGTFSPPLGTDGYSPVTVDIEPVIESLSVTENGTYTAPSGVDGYSPVTVDIEPVIESLSVTENGTYTAPSGVDGYSPVTVNVSERTPPTGYTQYGYIQSGGTAYIDTGLKAQRGMAIELEMELIETIASGWLPIFGGCTSNVYQSFSLALNAGKLGAFQYGNSYSDEGLTVPSGTRYIVRMRNGVTVNSTLVNFLNIAGVASFTSTANALLFGRLIGTTYFPCGTPIRVYALKIWIDDALVRDCVPVVRDSDSEAGLWDYVSETFFENQGSGAFVYG